MLLAQLGLSSIKTLDVSKLLLNVLLDRTAYRFREAKLLFAPNARPDAPLADSLTLLLIFSSAKLVNQGTKIKMENAYSNAPTTLTLALKANAFLVIYRA